MDWGNGNQQITNQLVVDCEYFILNEVAARYFP